MLLYTDGDSCHSPDSRRRKEIRQWRDSRDTNLFRVQTFLLLISLCPQELMSEPSMLRSQASIADVSVDSSGLPITPRGASPARDHCKHKPRFAEFACSHMEASWKVHHSVSYDPDFLVAVGLSLCSSGDKVCHTHDFVGL
jgi:hypothetical protein